MKTVWILGQAPNLSAVPVPSPGTEVWCANQWKMYRRLSGGAVTDHYTRWFNLHPPEWIRNISRREWKRLTHLDGTRPVYLQEATADVPGSVKFPREQIQEYFGSKSQPFRYFTLSAGWLIAFALFEGFERIELHGFELRQAHRYEFERPCFFWWTREARSNGVEVWLPPEIVPGPPGDPQAYTGPLYGYETHSLDPTVECELPVGITRLRRGYR